MPYLYVAWLLACGDAGEGAAATGALDATGGGSWADNSSYHAGYIPYPAAPADGGGAIVIRDADVGGTGCRVSGNGSSVAI